MDLPTRAPLPPEGVAIDPVCGMQVVIATSTQTAEYRGTTYHFCGRGCRLDFDEDPERFLDPSHVPSM
jgi:YHS domain-containing protein